VTHSADSRHLRLDAYDAAVVALARHLGGVPEDFPPEMVRPEDWERARILTGIVASAAFCEDRVGDGSHERPWNSDRLVKAVKSLRGAS
jgi:hypothetical protein